MSVEVRMKKDTSLWVKKVKVPGTKKKAIGGRGVNLDWTVTSGDPTLSRSTKAGKTRIRGMKGWSQRKGIRAERECCGWSSIRVDVSTIARGYISKYNEDQSVITTVGKHDGGDFQVQKTETVDNGGGFWTSRGKSKSCSWMFIDRSWPWIWICCNAWRQAAIEELRTLQNSEVEIPKGKEKKKKKKKQRSKGPIEKQKWGRKRSAANLAIFESVGSVTVARTSLGVHIVAHLNWHVKAVMGDLPPTKFPRALPTSVERAVLHNPKRLVKAKEWVVPALAE